MPILSCHQVTMAYDRHTVVEDVNFSVEPGEYLCIAGENGSGKSTLLKGLLGLLPVKSGQISFCGLRQNEIGYLPQQTAIQKDFPAIVREVVLSGCLNRPGWTPFYTQKDRTLAQSHMQSLGILPLARKSYRELSGGQQQRVLLARALCATHKLLLLDEPAAGLDPLVTGELYELIGHLNKKHGITLVVVSHDVKNVLKYADKVLHMAKSALFFSTPKEYAKSDVGCRFLGGQNHD